MPRNALIVFAKRPKAGEVKTRLTSLLTPEEAAQLYKAFLRDALEQYSDLDVDVRLYLSPTEHDEPLAWVSDTIVQKTQVGSDLGARMQHAFLESFAAGYERLVIIGTDHPTLPSAFIEHAFNGLTKPLSISIGPSEDGGFYLLGMNDFYGVLFRDMTYSHDGVFAQTMERASQTRAQLTILPIWYDVDTPDALHRLWLDLKSIEEGRIHTRAVIQGLVQTYPELSS